jgi:DNA-binding protein H-NS
VASKFIGKNERQSQVAKKAKKAKKVARAKSPKLAGMDFQSLMDLREQVESALSGYRTTLEQQLASIGGSIASVVRGRGPSKIKGRKVAPKFRGPDGETWAGRGATPRWLVAAMKETKKKRDDFLIDKAAGKRKRKA